MVPHRGPALNSAEKKYLAQPRCPEVTLTRRQIELQTASNIESLMTKSVKTLESVVRR